MKRANTLAHISTVIATLSLASAYAFSHQPMIALPIIAMGVLWSYARWKEWFWVTHAGFIFFLIGVTAGVLIDLQSLALLLSVASILAAWDLDYLLQRFGQTEIVENRSRLILEHLKRLLMVEVIGIGLGILSLNLTFQIPFGFVLLLGILLVIGLSRAVGMMREVIFGEGVSMDWRKFRESDPLPLRHSFYQARIKNYLEKFKQESSDH